ncbi:MAG: hypothetical protein ACI8UD_003083 [Planctomycetota bacterium]|jgi:hypothetical protein
MPRMSFESKYVGSNRIAPLLLERLGKSFAPDGEHPINQVHSVYFDTPASDAFAEVDNGDFYKTKVRLRWYGADSPDARPTGPAFLECKRKFGPRRDKLRVRADAFRRDLPLHHPAWMTLPYLLREQGAELPAGLLQPTLHITYRRHRFVEPTHELRIALDYDIRAVAVHPRFSRMQAMAGRTAPWLVFEAKGSTRQLPASLRFVPAMGARRQAFSKYGLWNDLL